MIPSFSCFVFIFQPSGSTNLVCNSSLSGSAILCFPKMTKCPVQAHKQYWFNLHTQICLNVERFALTRAVLFTNEQKYGSGWAVTKNLHDIAGALRANFILPQSPVCLKSQPNCICEDDRHDYCLASFPNGSCKQYVVCLAMLNSLLKSQIPLQLV